MLDKPQTPSETREKPGLNDDIGEDTRLELYRSQILLREAEQRAYDLFLQNLVKGTSHLSLGQEAVAAGFAAAMKPGDLSFCTYRGHAHTLARGVPVEKVLGELMRRDNGLMRGKGGSMHLTSVEHGVMGSYAIIGAHLPIACGAAWRAQYRGHDDVSVCFFGDGTTNIGAFHEALNFAAIWKLPVIFVCENNLYMEYTPIARRDGGASIRPPTAPSPTGWSGSSSTATMPTRSIAPRATAYAKARARRRPLADRMHDLSPQRPFARRPGEIPAGRRTREVEGARSDQDLSRAAAEFGISRDVIARIEDDIEREVDEATENLQGGAAAADGNHDHRRLRRWRLRMAELTYRDAVARGIAQEMERDTDVVFLGEDVAKAGGVFKATVGLLRAVRRRCACATRRSPNRRSSARRWARR